MKLLTGKEVEGHLSDIIHQDTQEQDRSFDLTAGSISMLQGPGALDFGGSEQVRAPQKALEPKKQDPDDDYGWWDLPAGTYRVEFNEKWAHRGDGVGLVIPHQRLLAAGGSHPTSRAPSEGPLSTLLTVGLQGLRIKENARTSTLIVLE